MYEKVNALGIGAQGLGGLTTVLDVKIKMYPTHAASKPIAMITRAATRRALRCWTARGPVYLTPPSLATVAQRGLGAGLQQEHKRSTSTRSPRKKSPAGKAR